MSRFRGQATSTGGYLKVAEFPLRNLRAPDDAVITNDAQFIVTFDDWGAIGRTENAVVVYRGTGEYIKAWKLEDIFSEKEIKEFTKSTSSTWWRGEVRLTENLSQDPIVVISPESHMAFLDQDQDRKFRGPVWFHVLKMTFEKL